jgi:UDP-N-acetylmuramoyl-L-alanyl-D-glutamate--2,6-diaminopimelate ligase
MRTLIHVQDVVAWLQAQGARRLVVDSRQVMPGDAFVAWPGAANDGRQYVQTAMKAGAVACLVEAQGADAFEWGDAPVVAMPSLKGHAGSVASSFYANPSQDLGVVAITGTNGKTSSAWWCTQWLAEMHESVSMIGTLGAGSPSQGLNPTGFTTPDPFSLQGLLRQFVDQGQHVCVMEASSIGIVEGRLNDTHIDVAVFTNLSQDHLDYHKDMASYWAAKRALFDWPTLKAAGVNIDDAHGLELANRLCAERPDVQLWTLSINPQMVSPAHRHLKVVQRQWTPTGIFVSIQEDGPEGSSLASAAFNVVGEYNLSNLLGVLAVLRWRGHALQAATQVCRSLSAVPGRMQPAWTEAPNSVPLVLVDYAHTPDAVEQALNALKPLAEHRGGQLWCVLGCGGDRDTTKRPLMAAAAERGATHVVLTSDNPRSEDPLSILAAMQGGLRNPEQVAVEPDRQQAISWVIEHAQAQDVVLLAGKGHEEVQEVAGVKRPFSDAQEARQAMQRKALPVAGSAR